MLNVLGSSYQPQIQYGEDTPNDVDRQKIA